MNNFFNGFIAIVRMLFFTSLLIFSSCSKLVEVNGPYTNSNTDNVYNSDAAAVTVLNSVYAGLSTGALSSGNTLSSFMNFYPSLSADELTVYSQNVRSDLISYYHNELTSLNSPNIWQYTYPVIYTVNSAIEGISNSNGMSTILKNQLIGEAKFIRAFCYYYLTNLYGDVPLVLTSDYNVNSIIPRTVQSDVIIQIIADLKDAESLLSVDYLNVGLNDKTNERVAPIKWVATALLARVYLFSHNWQSAEQKATEVIQQSQLYSLVSINECFLKNNRESIWQLQPVNFGWNTEDAKLYTIPQTGFSGANPVYLSDQLVNSFEEGDLRRKFWIDSFTTSTNVYHFPSKYKIATRGEAVNEYEVVFRLAEQFLIRAEARIQQGKISEGIEDLNLIRKRAGLLEYSGSNEKSYVLNAILNERRVEFFTEWGHRWLDLKRTSSVDSVMGIMTPLKGGVWTITDKLYPISRNELTSNPKLIQNQGY